ncbi:MAG: MarR family winged helix-turn-helix transcriptional regulator [Puniceicoccales bacterium]
MERKKVDIVNKVDEKGDPHEVRASDPEAVFEAIHSLVHAYRSAQYRVLRDGPYELSHMEGKMLNFFSRYPGATLSDLVGHTGRDKGQLARITKFLREQGLLIATKDSLDKRSVHLKLSDTGLIVHKALKKQLGEVSEAAVANLSGEERSQLISLLERVGENIAKEQ